jgi:DHA3 family macrolide efflux protein-like MFS transporter
MESKTEFENKIDQQNKSVTKEQKGLMVLLQYPDFIKVWIGRTISRFGDALDGIAFMWLMYKLTGSTLLMGTVMAVSAIPSMFGMVAGVVVDRMDKKKVMIWMDLLRGISTAIIAMLYMIGGLAVWQLYAFAFFNSVCEVFAHPARASAMQVLVKKEHYLASNSLSQASGSAAEIFGMGIAAAIIGFWGVGFAILIDAISFVVSAFTAMIATIEKVISSKEQLNFKVFFHELFDGFRIIKSNTLIFINIIMACMINILLAPVNVLMPIYSDKILNAGERGYSIMGIGIMVGTLLGSLLLGQLGHRYKKSTLIIGGFMAFGACIGALGLVNSLIAAVLLFSLSGICLPIIIATGMSVVQEHTPKEKMGRVSSTMGTIALIGMPLGYAISGVVGERLNVSVTFILIGAAMVFICIPPLFNKEFRNN